MARLVKVGTASGETAWNEALADPKIDDVLLLEPGFYRLDQPLDLVDLTFKGLGASPEDTVIYANFKMTASTRYGTFENVHLMQAGEPLVRLPSSSNSYLTFRHCLVEGNGRASAPAIDAAGQVNLEIYSSIFRQASVSLQAGSDFSLEIADSEFAGAAYTPISLSGSGTASINTSRFAGGPVMVKDETAQVEMELNKVTLPLLYLQGTSSLNAVEANFTNDTYGLRVQDTCYANLLNCSLQGAVSLAGVCLLVAQNVVMDKLTLQDRANAILAGGVIRRGIALRDVSLADLNKVKLAASGEAALVEMSGSAAVTGKDLVFQGPGHRIAARDQAAMEAGVLASSQREIELALTGEAQVELEGVKSRLV